MMYTISTVLMRGGSSKGLYFLASDLPWHTAERDRILLAAMGSPDVRQIDGLGGGDEQTSKVMIVGPSKRPASMSSICLPRFPSSATLLISRRLAETCSPVLHLLPSRAVSFQLAIRSRQHASSISTPVKSSRLRCGRLAAKSLTKGLSVWTECPVQQHRSACGFVIPQVARPAGCCRRTEFIDIIDGVRVTCVDFANPVMMLSADDVGKTGHETKQDLDTDRPWLSRIESLRQQAALLMGMGDVSGSVLPKVMMLAPPREAGNIASRYLAPTSCHATHALTGAASILAAVNVRDSIAALVASSEGDISRIVIEHPSGAMEVECELAGRDDGGLPLILSASVVTTARPLFTGNVYVQDRLAAG